MIMLYLYMGPDVWGIGTGQYVWTRVIRTISTFIIFWSFSYNSFVKYRNKIGEPQHDHVISIYGTPDLILGHRYGTGCLDNGDTISALIILWSFSYNSFVIFYDKIGDPQHDRVISKSVLQ